LAAKDGHVLLANVKEGEAPSEYRQRLLQISKQLFKTPPEILGLLHGKRVILDHGLTNGRWVVTVYSHLSRIKKGLKVGDFVRQGTVIGYVGNSGTSQAGTGKGAHLHFEIRLNGHYLGEGMTPRETGELLERILRKRDHDELL
jgi:murein DD-endopeptidase MepM/ murein hydrolase activator NlpD